MKNQKSLIIVESPTKIRTLHKFLGDSWLFGSSKGHIKDLPPKTLGVDIEDNFRPKYTVIKGRKEVISKLKELANKAEKIFLAPDPDREGEAISWHLYCELNSVNNEIKRVSFNEITEKAVLKALENPRDIDRNLVYAQQARRILDRLVGYKISPLLRKKVGGNLSAGRVQSVALRLICEREEEIKNFIPREYWSIEGEFKNEKGENFKANLIKMEDKSIKLNSEKEVKEILEEIKKESYMVTSIKEKIQRKSSPSPFITSSLQQEASKKLNFTAFKTMRIAQELYEGVEIKDEGQLGLITYMRTDSPKVANEACLKAREYILENMGKEYLPKEIPEYKSRKSAQEAHEAIRPTIIDLSPESLKNKLSKDQYLLYNLIWSRFLASQMEKAEYLFQDIDIKGGKYLFRVISSKIKFDGFLKVYKYKEEREKEQREIPSLKEKEKVRLLKLEPKQHFTSPPPRFSEATLIKTLEEKGIGRPSTYVPIITTICNRNYVKREKGKFYPTELGMIVNRLLIANFPNIVDINFTSFMEEQLDKIENGDKNWIKILDEFWRPFSSSLEEAKIRMEDIRKEREVEVEEECPKCKSKLKIKIGRFGEFLACASYPECNYTKSKGLGINCPNKDCSGEIIRRRTKKGKIFYGCSNYPECNFVSWDEPTESICPDCKGILFKRRFKNREYLVCINKDCQKKEEI